MNGFEIPKILRDPELRVIIRYDRTSTAWSARVEPEPGTHHWNKGRSCSSGCDVSNIGVALEWCAAVVGQWPGPDPAEGSGDAPPPPKTVTVELSEDDARWWAHGKFVGEIPSRLGGICRTALEASDG